MYREEQLQKKIEKQKKSVAEKQEKEREKEERLEALREQVCQTGCILYFICLSVTEHKGWIIKDISWGKPALLAFV